MIIVIINIINIIIKIICRLPDINVLEDIKLNKINIIIDDIIIILIWLSVELKFIYK
jgi:hypothetical protein